MICLRGLSGSILLTAAALADTVTLRDNVGYNGSVVSLDANFLVLQAKRADGTMQDIKVPRANVVRIEFNNTKVNVGPPPDGLGAHQGGGTPTPAKQDKDKIILRGGQSQACPGITLQGDAMKCGDKTPTRDQVWRVYLTQAGT
jgi:hypothetical protein